MMKRIFILLAVLLFSGPALAAYNASNIPVIANIAAMQALGTSSAQYPTVNVLDYGHGIGGGGLFAWSSGSTATIDHCNIFTATGVGTGRWIRQSSGSAIALANCGAAGDDSTDDTLPWGYAIALGASNGLPVNAGGLTYKVSGNLSIDLCHTGIIGSGGIIDAAALTSQTLLTLTMNGAAGFCNDPNKSVALIASHPITGMSFFGSGANTATFANLVGYTLGGAPYIPNVTITNGGAYGFNSGLVSGGGSFALDITNFQLGNAANALIFNAGANSGERNSVTGGFINNNSSYAVLVNSGVSADIHFYNTSIDGPLWVDNEGTSYVAFDGHLENFGSDMACLLKAGSQDGSIVLSTTTFMSIDINKNNAIGCSNVAGSHPNTGGITLGGFLGLGATTYTPDTLISGPGPARAVGLTWTTNPGKIPLAPSADYLSDPTFSQSTAVDFTATGGVTATIDTGTGPESSTRSMQLAVTSGNGTAHTGSYPIYPQSTPSLVFWLKSSGITAAGGSIGYSIVFQDIAGNALATQSGPSITSDVASFTQFRLQLPTPAPVGAHSYQVSFFVNSPSGASTVHIGNVYSNPY